ncbi:peptidoglycan binding protein CsiV [Microbulbifer sp. OS29]|uniref:Peptidoglycan binding protein CsiV n=1 Tax=Microbulbifer okhotskensis TaxID=2926617 RepID=A0A9X2J5E7_9GAMM|nr:CsiV family protein [Microbulbifer okhotskensis]MCO1333510.1 peptidoglycan binding protein CsiV [Microbulbifer okhotskensis]
MKRIISLCSTLALTLAASSAQAVNYAGNTFEIEMIVFERPQGMERTAETWPAAPRLQYPSKWVDFATLQASPPPPSTEEALSLVELTSTSEPTESLQEAQNGFELAVEATPTAPKLLLSPTASILGNKAAAISRAGDRVLFHKAWRQVLKSKKNSPAILINGGSQLSGHSQLEGYITLSVSRYLHISTNLWLSDFNTPTGEQGILLPQRPHNKTEKHLQVSTNSKSAIDTTHTQNAGFELGDQQNGMGTYEPFTLSEPSLVKEEPLYVARVSRLQHDRRLRSGQLHYIDHPEFGILIEIRTVAKPKKENKLKIDTPESNTEASSSH